MDWLKALTVECCSVDLAARTKDAALREIVRLACKHPAAAEIGPEIILRKLADREGQGSTGFGNGVALPHARVPGMREFVIGIALARRGVPFDALDQKRCKLLFFILGPEEATTEHLRALAAISRQLNARKTVQELLKSPTPTALYESFVRRLSESSGANVAPRSMRLMVLVLYMEELMYDVLQFFMEMGIDGATILQGSGMGAYISNVPLYAEFIGFMQERKKISQTILALIPAEREQQLVEGIEAITGDLGKTQGAMILTVDVSTCKGSMRML